MLMAVADRYARHPTAAGSTRGIYSILVRAQARLLLIEWHAYSSHRCSLSAHVVTYIGTACIQSCRYCADTVCNRRPKEQVTAPSRRVAALCHAAARAGYNSTSVQKVLCFSTVLSTVLLRLGIYTHNILSYCRVLNTSTTYHTYCSIARRI